MKRQYILSVGLSFILPFLTTTIQAETTYAMLIGVNQYRHDTDLLGAVNDAKDIEHALKQNGVRNIRVFLNSAAIKQKIEARWNEMVRLSKTGDTLIVSFAGHGMQLKDSSKDERDGKDEAFALSNFDNASLRSNKENYILDDEWYKWFGRAKGRRIIFVADSCYSGTVDKSILRNIFPQRLAIPPYHHRVEATIDDQPSGSSQHHSNVLMLAATIASKKVKEVGINGVPRGALSWAFANGMRGRADTNNDGMIGGNELSSYVRREVQAHNREQTPQFSPRNAFNSPQPIFTSARVLSANKKQLNIALSSIGDGAHVNFATTGNTYPYLTLYNITQNGTVQFLYPQGSDEVKHRVRDVFNLKLRVDRAFTGNEKIVAIYSVQP
ncbi:MAG: caspase family protein, partial [Cocleimonas sp.]|nr:caspase family protein [Cocleimonas sp.]